MARIRDLSITARLTWMNMLVSAAALLLACGAFLGYARVIYRQTMVRYLTMRARVVGANCISAVLFDDPKAAGDTLSALRADEHIVGAWVYTPQGEPFAGFWRDRQGSAPSMPAIPPGKSEAFWFANDQLALIRSITFQGKVTAFVYFESDLNELRQRQIRYLEIGALVLLASLLTAFLVSRFFGQVVARPIRALFDIATAVSRNKDYSLRAAVTDNRDEISVLVRAFNQMLAQIQERDEAVRKSAASLAEAQQVAHVGSWEWNVETDKAWWSDEMYRLYGVDPGAFAPSLQHALEHIPAEDREMVRRELIDGYEGRKPIDFHHRITLPDGSVRIVHARAEVMPPESGKLMRVVGVLQDITARKRAEDSLKKRTEELAESQHALEQKLQELARSNSDLEQFAYIASHDLQEPLRTVASFAQLLQRRYKGKLDSNADEFIHYMVDGASRMQGLINDLLAFSRVGSRGKEFAPTDFTGVVEVALENLQAAIAESHAEVTHDPLPTVNCDGAQLTQVLQNLVGNGIKFHNSKPPRVHIGVKQVDSEWVFSVKDNGIGIDPQFNQRIFEVFQRLHTRKEYPGSGIGLSITKKIVERHGGRIWVESQPGEGANFLFTLPA